MHTLYLQEEFLVCICSTRYARCHICKGACNCTNCNSNWANKMLYILLLLLCSTFYTKFPWNGQDPEIIAVNPNRQNMFNMTTHWWWQNQRTVVLLLYIAKLQVMGERTPLQWFTVIYTHLLWILYIGNIIGKCDLKTVSVGWWFS